MRTQLAFMGALLLAAGCAHRNYENRVVVSDNRSPYVGNTYDNTTYRSSTYGSTTYTTSPSYNAVYTTDYYTYPPYSYSRDYDNSSKGSGARAMMANPYAEYEPAGTALVVGEAEPDTSRGAGARSLKGETVTDNSGVVATTTTTETDTTSQGQGARTLTGSSESTGFARDDAAFVREAGQAGLAEVKMGQLAQSNGQNDQVKDFGQRLVNDHSKANEELSRLATGKGFQVPTTMSAKDDKMLDHMSSLNGADFDKACSRHAVEAHEKAIKLFRTEAQSGQDADLKAFAQRTLPTLEEHLRMAKQLNKSSKED